MSQSPSTPPAPPRPLTLLPLAEGNRHHYRYRLAKLALADAPGHPMYGSGGDPNNIVAVHYHAGRCDQSAKRIREHAELNAEWTRRLEAVGFTVRPARQCGIIATCALPPTEALVEPHGPAEEFTRKVTFPAYGVGGLLRLVPTHASADYWVLTADGDFLWTVKQLARGVETLALHWGLPDDDVPITLISRAHRQPDRTDNARTS